MIMIMILRPPDDDLMMIRSDAQRLGPGERASDVTRGGARSDIDDELVIIQSERNCSTSQFLVSLSEDALLPEPCCAAHSNYLSQNLDSRLKS